jgi:DNA-binding Lrp family transcriptional regulator
VEECHRVTGNFAFIVKAHLASTDDLESLVDDLQDAGAKCSTNIVLSTPIIGAPIVPPEGTVSERTRLTRRRRRTNAARVTETPRTEGDDVETGEDA